MFSESYILRSGVEKTNFDVFSIVEKVADLDSISISIEIDSYRTVENLGVEAQRRVVIIPAGYFEHLIFIM